MSTVASLPISRAERASWAMNDVMRPAHLVTMVSELDATEIVMVRDAYKRLALGAPSYTAIVIKAAALALKRNPQANRAILGFSPFKKLYQFTNIDLSVAVEKSLPFLPGQALAETVVAAHEKSLQAITEDLKKYASDTPETNERWRVFLRILKHVPRPLSNLLIELPRWFPTLWVKHRGCACWVNAPSKAGADLVFTAWPWPLTVSFGKVKLRPWVVDGAVVARQTMPVVMVFDRRIMGGGPAGRVLAQLVQSLEQPRQQLLSDEERAQVFPESAQRSDDGRADRGPMPVIRQPGLAPRSAPEAHRDSPHGANLAGMRRAH